MPQNALLDRFFYGTKNINFKERNLVTADDIFTNDFITESMALESNDWTAIHEKGPESMKHHVQWWLDIIPDAKMKVIDIAASEDKIISSWELRGTMKKAVFGIKPNEWRTYHIRLHCFHF